MKIDSAEIAQVVENFGKNTAQAYGYPYTAGFLESFVCNLIRELPAKKQKAALDQLKEWAIRDAEYRAKKAA